MKLLPFLICAFIASGGVAAAQNAGKATPAKRVPAALMANPSERSPRRMMVLKTNAVAWGATIMNIEGEIQVGPNVSLTLPIWYCPWFVSGRHALRTAAFQPEARWWLSAPGEGHFGGIHASIAWYNLKWGNYRYQDQRRPLLGAGITYGYAFRFSPHWGLEMSIGAGYFNLRYDRFYNTGNGRRIDVRQTSYFGPDHLSVSVAYHINP